MQIAGTTEAHQAKDAGCGEAEVAGGPVYVGQFVLGHECSPGK